MNLKKPLFLLIALITLAISGWYFASSNPIVQLDDDTLNKTTDTIVSELKVRQFDEQGNIVNYLYTPVMQHIPYENVHLLQTPHIIIGQKNESPLDIKANKATSIFGGKEISLDENVIINQLKNGELNNFKTSHITYFPKTKFAQTKEPVTIDQNGNKIEAVGLKASLIDKHIEFLSNTKGSYNPKNG